MNIFLIYAMNFFASGTIGVILLSWFQNLYLNGDTQLFIDTLPLTMVSLFVLAAIVLVIAYFTIKPLIKILSILKSEDRNIQPKYNRGCDLDFEIVYDGIYKKCGVTILDFENKS